MKFDVALLKKVIGGDAQGILNFAGSYEYFNPGELADVLESCGQYVFMHHSVFFRDDSPYQRLGAYDAVCELFGKSLSR